MQIRILNYMWLYIRRILCFHFWIIKYSVIITWRNNYWAFPITVATPNLATVLTRTSRGAMTITLTSTLASVIPVTTPSLRTIYNKGLCHVSVGNWKASSFSFLKYIYFLNVPTRAAFIFIAGLCLDVSWSIDRAMNSTVLWRRVVAFTVSAPLCTSTGLRALLPIIKIFPATIYCKFSSQNLNNKPKMAVTNINGGNIDIEGFYCLPAQLCVLHDSRSVLSPSHVPPNTSRGVATW